MNNMICSINVSTISKAPQWIQIGSAMQCNEQWEISLLSPLEPRVEAILQLANNNQSSLYVKITPTDPLVQTQMRLTVWDDVAKKLILNP